MQVVCSSGCSRVSWNHKAGKRLSDLSCPVCGGRYRKARFSPAPDQLAEARALVARMETASDRVEAALAGFRDLGPALLQLGEVLAGVKSHRAPHLLLKGGVA